MIRRKLTKTGKSKHSFFKITIVLSPIIIIIILEILLRLVGFGNDLSLFIKHPDEAYKAYKVVNPEIGKKYFQTIDYSHPAKDIYLKNKPDSVFRIFVMGSSTVVGFPYDNNLMFSRILNKRLQEAYSDKKIEIINTGIAGINSFSLLDFIPQVLKEKPDAILIYAGHNEFYGAFVVGSNEAVSHNPMLMKMHLSLMKFRFYQLTRSIINVILRFTRKSDSDIAKQGHLMTQIVKNTDITYNSVRYNKGIKEFQKNLDLMLAMAKSKGVPVYISNVVSNLSGNRPLKSIETNELEGAEKFFLQARRNEARRDFKLAHENYTKAIDYDCVRIRASSDINIAIERSALKYDATLVPTLQFFEEKSRSGIIGNNLMNDQVYPNINGEFLLAESFFQSIVSSKIIDDEVNINSFKSYDYFYRNYGFTYLDYLIAKHRIANLKCYWPLKDDNKEFVDYLKVYKPTSMIDSLAFGAIADKDKTLLEAHETLADKYKNEGDLISAFREYDAVVQMNPYISEYYCNAADCLLKMGDLKGALDYFEKSNVYGNSFHAHFKAGEICLIKNDIDNAISHFEKANVLTTKSDRLSLLAKLYIAYTLAGELERAKFIYSEIDNIEPGIEISIPTLVFSFNKYVPLQVQLQIDDADEYLARDMVNLAEKSLLKSLNIYDTPIANFKLGEIYYNKNEHVKSLYHLKKVYNEYKGDITYLHDFILVSLTNGKKEEAQLALKQLKKVDAQNIDIEKLQGLINDFAL